MPRQIKNIYAINNKQYYKLAKFTISEREDNFQCVISNTLVNDHATIHIKPNNTPIFTLFSPDYSNTWSESKRQIAKEYGYKNWKEHGSYVAHEPLIYDNRHLFGLNINLSDLSPIANHDLNAIIIKTNKEFVLDIIFCKTIECGIKFPYSIRIKNNYICFSTTGYADILYPIPNN